MIRFYLIAICALVFQGNMVLGQSTSQIRRSGIKKMNVQTSRSDSTGKQNLSTQTFDKKGRLLEECERTTGNTQLECTRFSYTRDGELLEELTFASDSLKSRIAYEYNSSGRRIAKVKTDNRGKILGTEKTEWNVWGEKTVESIFDADAKLKRKTIYDYNNRNLLVKRIIQDGSGKVISEKNYEYDYFK